MRKIVNINITFAFIQNYRNKLRVEKWVGQVVEPTWNFLEGDKMYEEITGMLSKAAMVYK